MTASEAPVVELQSRQGGFGTIDVSSDVVLSIYEDRLLRRVLKLNGSPAGGVNLSFPKWGVADAGTQYTIHNASGQTVTVRAVATRNADGTPATFTTGVAVTNGQKKVAWWDGSDFVVHT